MKKNCFIPLHALWQHFPAVFLCLLGPGPCLPDSLPPDSLCLLNGHCPGLASSVAPKPEIHLVEFAAVPSILLDIGRCCIRESAVLEFFRNNVIGGVLGIALVVIVVIS